MKPGVTLAMIVKNESRCLARCIESVRPAVDAIAVVDTGSQDGTPAIAMRYGAEVRRIEWPDAFDAARNASLEMVETEWTLWLDADEWLVDGAGFLLKKASALEGAFAYYLIRRDLHPDGRHGEQALLRLWRTDEGVRFSGVIHESLNENAMARAFPGKKLFQSDIAFWHDGYQGSPSQGKLTRNLPLRRRELELRPGQLYYEIELAETLRRLADPEFEAARDSVADRLLSVQDSDEPPCVTAALFLTSHLADLQDEELRGARTDALMRVARGWFPNSPSVLTAVAQVEVRRGNLAAAFSALVEVERMAESGRYDRTHSTNPIVLQEGLSTNLALVAERLGRADVARRNFERLLRLQPDNELARSHIRNDSIVP